MLVVRLVVPPGILTFEFENQTDAVDMIQLLRTQSCVKDIILSKALMKHGVNHEEKNLNQEPSNTLNS